MQLFDDNAFIPTSAKLLTNWMQIYAVSRGKDDLDAIKSEYPESEVFTCDLAQPDMVKSVLQEIPAPHMVVNNAGITNLDPFLDTAWEDFDAVMNVNVRAALIVSQICAQKMVDSKIAGSIVNVSSMASEIGLENHTSYCTSKGAINQMTRVMALELGKYGIRTNCVGPTIVFTAMGRLAWSDKEKNRPMRERIPLGKFCEVEDVVKPIMFLLSDDAAMVNGAMLPMDGGFLASPFSCVDDE
mmetsp:Transcript_37412/g.60075  ORF Transcript_37412/g.60075 Transcript_37412/m.60075 type:complete len:242 (+) Transcript_37412:212-937(+)